MGRVAKFLFFFGGLSGFASFITIPPVLAYQGTLEREASERGITADQAARDDELSDLARQAAFDANDPVKFWREFINRKLGRDPGPAPSA